MNWIICSVGGRAPRAAESRRRFQDRIRPPKLTHLPLQRDQPSMLIRRRPRPGPLVDLGSLNPPAKRVRRDTELVPNPRANPTPAAGSITRIKHKTHRTPAKLFSDIYVVPPSVLIHFRGIKNLH